jgi:hypothetical protein
MQYHSYKSATHPIHEDIVPIISALRHGYPNIANLRFKRLLHCLGLMRWEGVVIRNLIHKRMQDKKIK